MRTGECSLLVMGSRDWVPLANTPLPSLIVPFCARIYGGPQLSRQNQKPHGKNKIPHGKTENLKAKTKTSRQNRKPQGKNENLMAKPKNLFILFSPWSFWFCREVFCFCRDSCGSPYESDSNSEIWLLRWYQTYCLKLCSLSLDVIGERTTGKFLAVS